jgi:oligoendopeptidase F
MLWFLKPDIPKLKEKKDLQGLSKAIKHKDPQIRKEAIKALLDIYISEEKENFKPV